VKIWILTALLLLPFPGLAQDKAFDLAVPTSLAESGLIDFLLPRFSLKTGVRITLDDAASVALGDEGTPVFKGPTQLWHLTEPTTPAQTRFKDWLLSNIGKRTINSFEVDGTHPFDASVTQAVVVVATPLAGDAARGKTLSVDLCGNCHVVGPENRMKAIGSTPSFMLMRAFSDWRTRFDTFYKLRPHSPFTFVKGVTDMPSGSPSTRTITMERADVDAITAFVGGMAPADLGAPIQSQ
jgi:hypothetical protein